MAARSREIATNVPMDVAEEDEKIDTAASSRKQTTDVLADTADEGVADDVVLGTAFVPTKITNTI